MRFSPSRTLAATLLAGAAGAFGAAGAAAQSAQRIAGFTPDRYASEAAQERAFQAGVSAADLGRLDRALSTRPRLVGTPGDAFGIRYSIRQLRRFGLRPHTRSYSVYISDPRRIQVTMTKPTFRVAKVKENPYPGQRNLDQAVVGYNAYSPRGDVTGQLVYANYGLPDDYAALARLGVSVRGRIVIVRYGKSFRGVKAKVAQDHGAKGVIIYSDPADDGYKKGPVYPNGPWRPADSIQRGSIQYLFFYPGDPLTPGRPSVPGTRRLAPDKATDLARIPTTPLSYGEAQPMLAALAGPAAPKEFQGGLPFTYHVGPGPTEARLNLDIRYHQAPVRDVITEIRGTRHPEQKVIVGGHLDAWVYGSNDNTSGWSAVMQIGRGLGRMLRQGWRPDRTIVLAGWDGEEYGLLGSTEWGEQRIRDLRRNAVAYINMDAVAGKQFYTSAVPALDNVITAATKTVRLGSGSVYDSWTKGGKQKATVDRLGSGSDYTVLLDHIGVPALDLGFSTDSGEYHSTIDDTFQLEHFLDPGYRHSAIAARLSGVAALRLANADVPWLRYSTYATAVQGYVRDLQKIQRSTPGAAQVPLGALITQAQRWQRATAALERHARRLLGASSATTRRGQRRLAAITRTLLRQERLLTVARGLSSRPWFKHQIYAPGILTGYAAQYLPGLEDPVKAGNTATVTRYRDLLLGSLRRATAEARRAATS